MDTPWNLDSVINQRYLKFFLSCIIYFTRASLVAQLVKNLLAMQKIAFNAGDPGSIPGLRRLEKEMATHSNILAWEILWIEEPGGL